MRVALLCSVAVTLGVAEGSAAAGHLPAARDDVDLLSALALKTPDEFKLDPVSGRSDPAQPDLVEGQVADLTVLRNTAYLASRGGASCRRGGFFSVDLSDARKPRQLAFVPARRGTVHGEGTHAVALDTPSFRGDVLALNNEFCAPGGVGGFDLYDVSDPAAPKPLVLGYGDQSPDRARDEAKAPTTQDPGQSANNTRSISIWQDGRRAYAATVDVTELADIDIFDITDPRSPAFVLDVDLRELAIDQGVTLVEGATLGNDVLAQDVVVRRVGGRPVLLASYRDAGTIEVDLSSPSEPRIIGDSTYGANDPLFNIPRTGVAWPLPPGNAHHAEFSHDGRFVLAADEDLSPYRLLGQVDTGAGEIFNFFSVGPSSNGPKVSRERSIAGDSVFVGNACVDTSIPAAAPEAPVAVVERGGGCSFQVKIQNADARGYDRVIIFNATGADCESPAQMTYTGDVLAVSVARSVGLRLLGLSAPGDACAQATPAAPRAANEVFVGEGFDGWGALHLYDSDLAAVDHFAIEEATDERFASGFGELSVHEVATDPTEDLAYSSYRAGGLRVLSFGPQGLREVGRFIAPGGNDLWGVEAFDHPSEGRLIGASDRDRGLYLYRYVGPGAAVAPRCADAEVTTSAGTPVTVPLSCSDANGNPLTLSVASSPAHGAVGAVGGTAVVYTPAAGFAGEDAFTYRAEDGALSSAPATVRVRVAAPPARLAGPRAGACANDVAGTAARDLLKGSSAGERFRGGNGNDVIDGGGGGDCIAGQDGADQLAGDSGHDVITGGNGGDRLSGGSGRDRLEGRSGNDRLEGGTGDDRLAGGSGNDRLGGGPGRDTVRANSGRDTIDVRGGGRDTVDCGTGRDTVVADKADKVATNCETVRRR